MNAPTIIVALVVLAVFVAIIWGAIRNRKKGKAACSCGSCGGGCAGCPLSGKCHQ